MEARNRYQKIKTYLKLLKDRMKKTVGAVENIGILSCDYKTSNELPAKDLFTPYIPGTPWGSGFDSHVWFSFSTPKGECSKGMRYGLQLYSETSGWDATKPQFILYVDGAMIQGLDVNHREVFLDSTVEHDIYLYAYTGYVPEKPLFHAEYILVNEALEKLWYDISVPFDSLEYLEEYSGEYQNILAHLERAVDCLDMLELEKESEAFFASALRASRYMEEEFYGKFCCQTPNTPATVCIGHTHIDCAWLWTLKQTREKVQRSFATVTALMERYPEYKFMSSQALLYQNLKEEAPEIYEKVKALIREGRWECEGSMWVEADCNLSSGESLVRQLLYGKRFFRKEFGLDHKLLWLPDVFGYSAALPQILKKSGVNWFVTSKISWNELNQMPYDTFDWQGIDGTKLHSYFLTAQNKKLRQDPVRHTTYVGYTTPRQVSGTYDRYRHKDINNQAILTFGYGDGGGGPTAEQLETARRLSHGIPGTPQTKMEFAGSFLKRLEEKIENNPLLPVWQGELYLEFHRGTYTSVSKNKKNNRKCEFLFQNAEWAASLAKLLCGKEFPKNKLHQGWEMILTNQFHDIIPGSSIKEVYDQCDRDYAVIKELGEAVLEDSKEQIAAGISEEAGYVVFNPNSAKGNGLVSLSGVCGYVENIPPKGYACVKEIKTENSISVGTGTLENKFFRLVFDENMLLSSVYDKRADREVLKEGKRGNELRVYADYPSDYDAWEWQEYSAESEYRVLTDLQSCIPVQDGVRAGLQITRRHMDSTLTQTVWLYEDVDRVDFDTKADWHQKHQMLKAAFPVDINAEEATFEIQYGSLKRPTHKNTPWDAMKFETCAHKFCDLSEGAYGVSLLNDCKYGHDVHGGEMMLSLLKCATYPDPEADQGIMTCTYSLVPHQGPLDLPKISAMAYSLNNPMQLVKATGAKSLLPERFCAVKADKDNIFCEVTKEAEDGEDLIFRFYELANSKTKATLSFGFPVKEAFLCDLLENEEKALPLKDNQVLLPFGAFEIHTLKIRR